MRKSEKQKKFERYIEIAVLIFVYIILASRLPEFYYTNKIKFIIILLGEVFGISALIFMIIKELRNKDK